MMSRRFKPTVSVVTDTRFQIKRSGNVSAQCGAPPGDRTKNVKAVEHSRGCRFIFAELGII